MVAPPPALSAPRLPCGPRRTSRLLRQCYTLTRGIGGLRYDLPMGHLEHKAQSPAVANCYILTISDTRTEATDTSGRAIFDLLWAGGHQVAGRRIVRDEPDQVRAIINEQLSNAQ